MVTDILGPTGRAVFGTQCCQSCWHAPPITMRSPCPGWNTWVVVVEPVGRSRNRRLAPQRHGGHQRVGQHPRVTVTVPRHPVPAVAVEVDPDAVEPHAVTGAERGTDVVDHRRQLGQGGRFVGVWSWACAGSSAQRGRRVGPAPGPAAGADHPPRREPRLTDRALVHPHLALAPPRRVQHVVEQLVGTGEPAGCVVDPRDGVELGPHQ